MTQRVRVRFAPSPTGYLHVGGARTALYNYLFAKQHGGDFLLRIEDTDEARSTEESLRMQIADLKWLGLTWDEGPHPETLADVGGKGPYRQSLRKSIYHKYAEQLIEQGDAFYCFMSDDEVERKREELKAKGLPLQVNSPYRDLPLAEAKAKIANGEPSVIRFRVPDNRSEYVHQDLVRGRVTWPSEMISDFVIVRGGGMPVYNYVCAIDDALMQITHVFRAEEHLNNTLKQLLILEALKFPIPQYGHLSIILGEDKQKLSKRHGATSCHEYHEKGILPEALNNFIALLGWSDPQGREVLSMKEMIESFSEDRLHPSSAVFDEKKLLWMNSQHLRALDHNDLWLRVEPYLNKAGLRFSADPEWQNRALETFKSYMETLQDAVELFRPLDSSSFQIHEEASEALTWESTRRVFEKWIEVLNAHPGNTLSAEDFDNAQNQVKDSCQVKGKFLFMPIRVAIIGKPHGAELKILVPLMAKQQLLARAKEALKQVKA
jgi:nondiscriminating glutamyl-tRNA synthetase